MAGKEAEHIAVKEGEELATKEAEHAVEGEGEHAAESCALHSFAGDTLVATPDGEISIDALKVGDQVIATDVATGKEQAEPVQHVFIHLDSNLLDVTLADTAPNANTSTTQNTTNTQQQDAATKSRMPQRRPMVAKLPRRKSRRCTPRPSIRS